MSLELANVLNENGEPTGKQARKDEIFKNGWWRLVVHIWIVSPKTREVLIQQRAKKGIFDDLWDISVGGAVQAGEPSVQAAQREVAEELGLSFAEDEFELVGRFKVPKFIPERQQPMNEYSDTFLVKSEFGSSTVKMQESEVAAVGAIALDELIEKMPDSEQAKLWVPHGVDYYQVAAEKIREML